MQKNEKHALLKRAQTPVFSSKMNYNLVIRLKENNAIRFSTYFAKKAYGGCLSVKTISFRASAILFPRFHKYRNSSPSRMEKLGFKRKIGFRFRIRQHSFNVFVTAILSSKGVFCISSSVHGLSVFKTFARLFLMAPASSRSDNPWQLA